MKKKMLAWLLIVLAAVFVATRRVNYHVERSTIIDAPGEVVFAQIDDFHKWEAWSPWGKRDPSTTVSYEGPESGQGASYHWTGNKEVGEGRMTIIESSPGRNLSLKLHFVRPYSATTLSRLILLPEEPGVSVVWMTDGKLSFVEKAMGVDKNIDRMIGPNFEKGLAGLKSASEAAVTQLVTPSSADSSLSETRARPSP